MKKKLVAQITLRNDTTANWEKVADTVVLLPGEIALEYSSIGPRMKIGDGVNNWTNLPYFITEGGGGGDVELPDNFTWGMLFGTANEETSATTELGLIKPGYGDLVDIQVLNANADLIEEKIVSLTEQIVAKEEQITNLQTTIENQEEAITSLGEQITAKEEIITNHEERIAFLENNGSTSEEIIARIDENALAIHSLGETVRNYEERIVAAEEAAASIDQFDDRITDNSNLIEEHRISLEEQIAQNTLQEEAIQENTNRLDALLQYTTEQGSFDGAEIVDARTSIDGTSYSTLGTHVRALGDEINYIKENTADLIGGKLVDGLSYVDNKLQLTANGVLIGNAVEIRGGGGGSISSYEITLNNLLDDRIISVAKGEQVELKFNYLSVDKDNFNDGNGIGTVYVNEIKKLTFSAVQGENVCDITNYLSNGSNTVKLTVENSEGAYKTIVYTITVIALALTTTASTMDLYTGAVSFPYVLTGNGQKTVHFIMDEYEMGTEVINATESSRTFNIPVQLDGAHILTVYAEVENEGIIITSNVLKIGMMWYSSTMTDQAVLINFDKTTATQGETITIPYMCYNPHSQSMEVDLNIYDENGVLYDTKQITVDQTPKTWVTQNYPIGNTKFEIVCGNATESITIAVAASSFDREILTDSLVLEFTANGRSNSEPNPENWQYGEYVASFSGFGWAGADGWVEDKEGQTVLRFLPGNEMTIPYLPFAADFRNSGYTIEAEFASHNVRDYETIIATSFSGNRGFQIRSQYAELASEQSYVSTQFREDTRVRVAFVVEQKNLNRFIYTYINGIMCDVAQYPESDNFGQSSPVGITIGAEACGLDLYVMRFYNRGLTYQEQLNNFICDRATLAERQEIDERNNILDENGEITIATLPMQIPYLILECEELPQYKGDKKKNKSTTFVDRLHPERSFTATGVQLDVQGTSSAGYPLKNYKISLKNGLTYTNSGAYSEGFPVTEGGIPGQNICFKTDFASSENANNIMLVDYYEQNCPFKSPPQITNDLVRQGVRGFPICIFWQNTETGEVTFVSKGNFNDDKSNENVFGFDRDVYPNCECWEICNNTSNRVLFKESEYEETITVAKPDGSSETYPAWYDDFEARFPDLDEPYRDNTQLKRLTDWLVSTDTEAVDTAEEKAARLEKFKNEFEQYFIKDACIFYYLFTECFLMVDNRAKNLFLTTFDGTHWFPIPYDFDTALGMLNACQTFTA